MCGMCLGWDGVGAVCDVDSGVGTSSGLGGGGGQWAQSTLWTGFAPAVPDEFATLVLILLERQGSTVLSPFL